MNNLHTEKRPDRNGNIVTRWVRSFGKSTSNARIPAPFNASRKKSPELEAEIKELCGMLQPPEIKQWSDLLENNVSFVAEQDYDLFQRITKSAQFSPHENDYWESTLGLGNPFRKQSREEQQSLLSDMRATLVIVPLLERIAAQGGDVGPTSGPDRFLFENIVRDYMVSGQIVDPSDSLVAAVVMTAYATGYPDPTGKAKGRSTFLDYASVKDDVEYIASRVEEVEAILPELTERRAGDREMIDRLLNAPAPSLHEGML